MSAAQAQHVGQNDDSPWGAVNAADLTALAGNALGGFGGVLMYVGLGMWLVLATTTLVIAIPKRFALHPWLVVAPSRSTRGLSAAALLLAIAQPLCTLISIILIEATMDSSIPTGNLVAIWTWGSADAIAVALVCLYTIVLVQMWRGRADGTHEIGFELVLAYVITIGVNVVPLLVAWSIATGHTSGPL